MKSLWGYGPWFARRRMATALVAVGLLTVTACGSGDDDPAAPDSDGTVTIMTMTSMNDPIAPTPELAQVAEAYEKHINANGGIDGHQLKVEICDHARDPNLELGCFRKAVSEKMLAVVGSFISFGDGLKLLEKADIPFIGGQAILPAEFTSPISYPLNGGLFTWYYGGGAILKEAGATHVGHFSCESNGCKFSDELISSGLKAAGVQTEIGSLTFGQPDYAPQVQTMLGKGVDAVNFTGSPADMPKVVRAVRQAGFTGPVAMAPLFISDTTLQALGGDGDGILIPSNYLPLSSGGEAVETLTDALADVDKTYEPNTFSEQGWSAFQLMTELAGEVSGELTSASLLEALETQSTPIDLPLTIPWVSPDVKPGPLKEYPHLPSLTYIPAVVDDGQIVASSPEPVDPAEVLGLS